MKHSLKNMVVVESFIDDENLEFYSQGDYIENMFDKVFEDLVDKNGESLRGKARFNPSYLKTIEKCNIENSMDLIYRMLNTHVCPQDSAYFKDDDDSTPSDDVLKVLEFMRHLHNKRIPKRFVGGFLVLMTKFVFFP